MERRDRADLALPVWNGNQRPRDLGDAVPDVEQRLRRRAAEAHQNVGIGELDLAL